MPNYDLNRLGEREFEHMSQSLLKKVIGNDTITFGEGRDGGREATFRGKAPYPSQIDFWEGEWVFQVKFHDTGRITHELARQKVLADLKTELDKIVNKYQLKCDNYILITNVPLSSVSGSGTHDRVTTDIVPMFKHRISNIRVWGADDIYRFLEAYSDVRRAYLHFLVPGDLIAELMSKNVDKTNQFAKAIKLYLNHTFGHEQFVQLDQAGGLEDDRLPLQRIFIDLDVQFQPSSQSSLKL